MPGTTRGEPVLEVLQLYGMPPLAAAEHRAQGLIPGRLTAERWGDREQVSAR